jgi:DNA repair exonuclease SbcCD ATPase subunit
MQDIWIKEVEITNFQSHKQTKVNLVNGTNALIGSSNSGKTAVIRAIQWCLLNIPNGNGFIRVGEDEATVKVTLSNGKIIERRRNKKGTVKAIGEPSTNIAARPSNILATTTSGLSLEPTVGNMDVGLSSMNCSI